MVGSIQRQDDVGSQQRLGTHHALGRHLEEASRPGVSGSYARVRHLAQLAEAEDLEAAAIRQDGARPAHGAVQLAKLRHQLRAGAQQQMVGVQDDLAPMASRSSGPTASTVACVPTDMKTVCG